MDIGIEGIKCDADGCGYEDMNIKWGTTAEEILAVNDEYLTKNCPDCGAPLLTAEDHASVKMMVLLMPELNALEEDLKTLFPEDHPANEKMTVRLTMDGSGKIGIPGLDEEETKH